MKIQEQWKSLIATHSLRKKVKVKQYLKPYEYTQKQDGIIKWITLINLVTAHIFQTKLSPSFSLTFYCLNVLFFIVWKTKRMRFFKKRQQKIKEGEYQTNNMHLISFTWYNWNETTL